MKGREVYFIYSLDYVGMIYFEHLIDTLLLCHLKRSFFVYAH